MLRASPRLQALLSKIADAHTEQELKRCFLDEAGPLFHARACGITLLAPAGQPLPPRHDFRGLPPLFHARLRELPRGTDPLLQAVRRDHAPVHNGLLMDQRAWQRTPFYQHVLAPCGLRQTLKAPLVGQGRLVGTVQVSRGPGSAEFGAGDLALASAVSAHLSTRLAEVAGHHPPEAVTEAQVTPREREIAHLVALGLTNDEIGVALHITGNSVKGALKRIFRKLDVSSRAALVARLAIRTDQMKLGPGG